MRVGMFLRVIEDAQMLLQISDDKGSFLREWTVFANANDKSILSNRFNMQLRVRQRKRYERDVNNSSKNLLNQLWCIPVSRADCHGR